MITRKLHIMVGGASVEFITDRSEVLVVVRACHNRASNEQWATVDELEVMVDQLHSLLDYMRERTAEWQEPVKANNARKVLS